MKTESFPKNNCEGFLVTYSSSKRNDITRINHFLLGRIVTIQKNGKDEKYYYPGILENQIFKKITNGCYFIQTPTMSIFSEDNDVVKLLKIIPAILSLNGNCITGKDYWKDKVTEKTHNW